MFVLMVFGWLQSPMYADIKTEKRLIIQEYLIKTYYRPDAPGRQELIEKYGFTDDEITPKAITLEKYGN